MAAPVRAIANLESESETKKDRVFKSSFNAWHKSGSLMPAIYIQYNVHLPGGGGGGHDFEISASTPTYTTMATTIAETSEDDTNKQMPTWISCVKQSKIRLSDETLNRGPDSLWSLKIPWHFS